MHDVLDDGEDVKMLPEILLPAHFFLMKFFVELPSNENAAAEIAR